MKMRTDTKTYDIDWDINSRHSIKKGKEGDLNVLGRIVGVQLRRTEGTIYGSKLRNNNLYSIKVGDG